MTAFNAYESWLGIGLHEQPPTLYRLLGVPVFESRTANLDRAAENQLSQVRPHLDGPHAEVARRLKQEILLARTTLKAPQRKAAYDSMIKVAQAAATPTPAAVPTGPDPTAEPDRNVGKQLGDYRLLEKVSDTTAGPIYRAQHKSGAVVELKILKPSAAKHAEVLKRFCREFQITRRLSHPNLIASFDLAESSGLHYLALEYVGGASFQSILQQHGPLPVEPVVELMIGAASGLAYLHRMGIYHRNIKPENLLVNHRGQLKIANLILAKLDDEKMLNELGDGEALTQPGQVLGSVDFLAPEQAVEASTVDGRADIYSLGCTIYTLLTGSPPYPAKGTMAKLMAHRTEPVPSIRDKRPDVPQWLDRAVRKMMAKEPAQRYASMDEVVEVLQRGGNLSRKLLITIACVAGAILLAVLGVMIYSAS